MIVVSMTNCPPKLRGDLSKWLLEINSGVYVGQVSARVREAIWKRICENIGKGQATMVFSTNNEQHMDFYVHNTSWIPIDFDGIKLIKRPNSIANIEKSNPVLSNDSKYRMNRKRRLKKAFTSYFLLDIETTGLSCENNEVLEIGLVEVSGGKIINQYDRLINVKYIPKEIEKLTGISKEFIDSEGMDLKSVLEEVFDMIDEKNVLIYNAEFDLGFLRKNAEKYSLDFPDIFVLDVLELAKTNIDGVIDYRLETVSKHLGIEKSQEHRALGDCLLMNEVYLKLNENKEKDKLG